MPGRPPTVHRASAIPVRSSGAWPRRGFALWPRRPPRPQWAPKSTRSTAMSLESVAVAVRRAKSVYARKPGLAFHGDAPATAAWQGGLRCVSRHANGARLVTDMPTEVGGTGDQVTPGWLFRAGLASCAATTFAAHAADEGIELTRLEIRVESQSDSRGFLGVPAEDGTRVYAGPSGLRMHVDI